MKTIEQKAKKVPAIRFAGFDGEWVNKIFGESFTYLQNNTLSRAELNSESGLAKNIHYGDVLVKFGECIDVAEENIPFVSDAFVVDKFKNSFLQDGDIVIADTAEDETVGKCTEMQGVNDAILLSGLHTIPSRPKEKYGSKFLGYYLNSSAYHQQLLPLMQGVKVLSISKSALQETNLVIPKDNQEQQKIGSFFSNIDSLISLEQKKYDKLTQVKKAMLEKMFPIEGATVPEIRFAGFTGDWEEKKFGEIVVIERGGSPRPIEKFITKNENGLNWVKIGDAPEQGNYITCTAEKIIPEGLSKTREVHPGDLILSNSMSFGRPYIMAIDGCIHDGWLLIRNSKGIFDLNFLCTLLGTENMLSQYKAMAAGSTVNNLNKELVARTFVSYPKVDEQKKIGSYFSHLDSLISLQQRKLDKLKNIKKSLLEKMFV